MLTDKALFHMVMGLIQQPEGEVAGGAARELMLEYFDQLRKVLEEHPEEREKLFRLVAQFAPVGIGEKLAAEPEISPTVARFLGETGEIGILQVLAKNATVSRGLFSELISSPEKGVRLAVASIPIWDQSRLSEMARDEDIWIRCGVYDNRLTEQTLRLRLMSGFLEDFGGMELDAEYHLPGETQVVGGIHAIRDWSLPSGNLRLVQEVEGWKRVRAREDSVETWIRSDWQAKTDVLLFGGDPFQEVKDVIGWRKAGDEYWGVAGYCQIGGFWDSPVRLPLACDGWLEVLAGSERTIVQGYFAKGDGKVHKWRSMEARRGIPQPLKKPVQPRYEGRALVADGLRPAEHVADIIIGYALLALWKDRESGKLLGWTQEANADCIPQQRRLSEGELLPAFMEKVFAKFEGVYRNVARQSLAL